MRCLQTSRTQDEQNVIFNLGDRWIAPTASHTLLPTSPGKTPWISAISSGSPPAKYLIAIDSLASFVTTPFGTPPGLFLFSPVRGRWCSMISKRVKKPVCSFCIYVWKACHPYYWCTWSCLCALSWCSWSRAVSHADFSHRWMWRRPQWYILQQRLVQEETREYVHAGVHST